MEKKNFGRKRLVSGLLTIAFLMAITVSGSRQANAQVECLGVCEEQLVGCIRNSGNGPQVGLDCISLYQTCVDNCLGNFDALFD